MRTNTWIDANADIAVECTDSADMHKLLRVVSRAWDQPEVHNVLFSPYALLVYDGGLGDDGYVYTLKDDGLVDWSDEPNADEIR